MLKKQGDKLWTGFTWCRIGTGDRWCAVVTMVVCLPGDLMSNQRVICSHALCLMGLVS
jgi:hypothetical protein